MKITIFQYGNFEFAVANNEPVFEDEYLYNKLLKKCVIEKINDIDIYLFDWNNNGQFKEIGKDYIGIKSNQENTPTIKKIDTINIITINGKSHELKIDNSKIILKELAYLKDAELNLITELTPIILENGNTYNPEIKNDSTVVYFWATWCKPCIETLINIDVQKLNRSGIDFIPIAYNCSGSGEFLEKHHLNFEDLIISKKSAVMYNIKSLSKQYTILNNKTVATTNVNLKNYYH